MKYDYLVVGSGLYGAVFAREAADRGKKVLVIDKRPNVAGNIYTEKVEGIHVHKYGAHIFHTNDTKVWKYITRFAEFNRFTNSPVANYRGELYSLPFNMYTFNKMWGVVTPTEAAAKIEKQKTYLSIVPGEDVASYGPYTIRFRRLALDGSTSDVYRGEYDVETKTVTFENANLIGDMYKDGLIQIQKFRLFGCKMEHIR